MLKCYAEVLKRQKLKHCILADESNGLVSSYSVTEDSCVVAGSHRQSEGGRQAGRNQ